MPPVQPLTQRLARDRKFASAPFVLIDVGASGGIEEHWRVFQSDLRAYGFDPLVKEVARLNQAERSADVRYFEGFVGCEHADAQAPSNSPAYERSSALRAQGLLGVSFTARFNNLDAEIVHSGRRFSLDQFCREQAVDNVDFLKVDTDGSDYDVLCGARGLLASGRVLGVFVEAQLHGSLHPHSNTFAGIDHLMRDRGFTLFDVEVYRYTRASLPGRFMYSIPAQTTEGPVSFAEAFYARDLAAPGYDARWGFEASQDKLLKLLCLYEIFGLPDCGAELLLSRGNEFPAELDVQQALDVLAKQSDPQVPGYKALHERFERSPADFFPSSDKEFGVSRVAADPRVARLQAELRALRNSVSWRVTAPLRHVKRLLSRR
jgi:FkbM family methyltransferase